MIRYLCVAEALRKQSADRVYAGPIGSEWAGQGAGGDDVKLSDKPTRYTHEEYANSGHSRKRCKRTHVNCDNINDKIQNLYGPKH